MFKKGLFFLIAGLICVGLFSCRKSPDDSSGSDADTSSNDISKSQINSDYEGSDASIPAGSDRKVVLYCSVDQVFAEPIVAEFEKTWGIKVDARFDTEASKTVGLVQKIRAEAANPVADVFWSSEVFYTITLAREGLLESYTSGRTKNWPKELTGKDNAWYGFGLRARVIAYNTNRVSDEVAPKLLEETLANQWKGRLAMATPAFGTTGGDVASWFAHYGQERATKFLKALKKNNVMIVSGNSTAVKKVATGQADICFTDTDDVYAAQRNGWPVKMNFLKQNGRGPLVIPNTAAVIKGGPNKDAAAVLMEFLLSARLEEALVQSDSHNSPIHPSLKEKYKQYVVNDPLNIPYEEIADKLDVAIKTSRQILR